MKLPNKIYTYKQSVIYDMVLILKLMSKNPTLSIYELYQQVKDKILMSDFLDTVCCLYVTDKIEYNNETKSICYVEDNQM